MLPLLKLLKINFKKGLLQQPLLFYLKKAPENSDA